MLTYILVCFSDDILAPEDRNELSPIYIGISCGNIALHLITLVVSLTIGIKLAYKRHLYQKWVKKMADALKKKVHPKKEEVVPVPVPKP